MTTQTKSQPIQENEIVLYQPNETTRIEVRLDDETVWLTANQMADLFGTGRQAITKHLQNIYDCAKLDKQATDSILELVRQEGKLSTFVHRKQFNWG